MSYVKTAALGAEALLYNTGRGVFRPGGHGGGIFDGNIAGLGASWSDWIFNPAGTAVSTTFDAVSPPVPGASASDPTAAATQAAQVFATAAQPGGGGSYPWGVYSADTLALQKNTNAYLKQYGYCPITEDGKLGKGTCGARQALAANVPGITNPSTCQAFTAPSKAPCGGGGSGGGGAALTPAQQAALTAQFGGGTDWTKYLLFAAGAGAVLAAAYYLDKKRKK